MVETWERQTSARHELECLQIQEHNHTVILMFSTQKKEVSALYSKHMSYFLCSDNKGVRLIAYPERDEGLTSKDQYIKPLLCTLHLNTVDGVKGTHSKVVIRVKFCRNCLKSIPRVLLELLVMYYSLNSARTPIKVHKGDAKWPLFVNKHLFWWSASITLDNDNDVLTEF